MASKWLPGYTYDASSGRYRRADTGRFVKRDTITDLLETSISQRARDIRKGFEAVLNEELGTTPWLHRTALELKREHLELAALAAGGWDRLTPADYARIDGRLNFDFKHLATMAREISEGTVSLAQGLNRLDMYLGSARREYLDIERNGRLARVKDGYALIAKRHLAPHAIHCTSCEEYALWPWRPADVVPVPTEACLCGNACRCDIEYKETPLVYMEVAEFNPHHDALGRFATGGGAMAADMGGGGGAARGMVTLSSSFSPDKKATLSQVIAEEIKSLPSGAAQSLDSVSVLDEKDFLAALDHYGVSGPSSSYGFHIAMPDSSGAEKSRIYVRARDRDMESISDDVIHELGHHVLAAAKEGPEWSKEYRSNKSFDRFTQYALTNPHEGFAETYCAYRKFQQVKVDWRDTKYKAAHDTFALMEAIFEQGFSPSIDMNRYWMTK